MASRVQKLWLRVFTEYEQTKDIVGGANSVSAAVGELLHHLKQIRPEITFKETHGE